MLNVTREAMATMAAALVVACLTGCAGSGPAQESGREAPGVETVRAESQESEQGVNDAEAQAGGEVGATAVEVASGGFHQTEAPAGALEGMTTEVGWAAQLVNYGGEISEAIEVKVTALDAQGNEVASDSAPLGRIGAGQSAYVGGWSIVDAGAEVSDVKYELVETYADPASPLAQDVSVGDVRAEGANTFGTCAVTVTATNEAAEDRVANFTIVYRAADGSIAGGDRATSGFLAASETRKIKLTAHAVPADATVEVYPSVY